MKYAQMDYGSVMQQLVEGNKGKVAISLIAFQHQYGKDVRLIQLVDPVLIPEGISEKTITIIRKIVKDAIEKKLAKEVKGLL